jgi:DinB superfamily
MDTATRRAGIEKYREGYRVVSDALRGNSDQELDARPAPGKWSAREIAHHLADSEMTSAIRLRRLITEEPPVQIRRARGAAR